MTDIRGMKCFLSTHHGGVFEFGIGVVLGVTSYSLIMIELIHLISF